MKLDIKTTSNTWSVSSSALTRSQIAILNGFGKWMKGKKLTKQWKKNISKSNTGRRFYWKKDALEKNSELLIKKGKRLKINCSFCGSTFFRAKSLQKGKTQFCSRACYSQWMKFIRKKEDHPLYRGIGDTNSKLYRKRAMMKDPVGFREKRNFNNHQREDNKRKFGGRHSLTQWKEMKEKNDHKCLSCGRKEPEIKLSRDHIIPLTRWDEWSKIYQPKYKCNDIENIQPLCISCNCKKNNKLPKESMGFNEDIKKLATL